jgi:hypothetical protein
MWQTLGPLVKPYGHFERVENAFGSGMPDVNYCVSGTEGWLELKARPRWPKNPTDHVALDHYTDQQRRWCKTRCRAKGNVWWMLKCDTEHVLLRGDAAALLYDGKHIVTKAVLFECASWISTGIPDPTAVRSLCRTLAQSMHS